VSTPCCHVFMHRSCYNSMVERLPTCGNCREPNVDHVPDEDDTIILETDEELDVESHDEEGIDASVARLHRQLNEYRWEYRHLHTHYAFGVRYLTPSTPPLGLSITLRFGVLRSCFPINPCISMVWWNCP